MVAGDGEAVLPWCPLHGPTGTEGQSREELCYPQPPASWSCCAHARGTCLEPRFSLFVDISVSFAAPPVVGGLRETQHVPTDVGGRGGSSLWSLGDDRQESCSSAGNCQADEQTVITQLSRP